MLHKCDNLVRFAIALANESKLERFLCFYEWSWKRLEEMAMGLSVCSQGSREAQHLFPLSLGNFFMLSQLIRRFSLMAEATIASHVQAGFTLPPYEDLEHL